MNAGIQLACDADLKTKHNIAWFRNQLQFLTLEWAVQEHNRSVWEPRPWPGESNE